MTATTLTQAPQDTQVTELIATLAGIQAQAEWGAISDDARINTWIARNANAFIVRIESGCTPPEAVEAATAWLEAHNARYGGAK